MAKDQQKRLRPRTLREDTSAYNALKAIEGYAPVNGQYTLDNSQRLYDDMMNLRATETQIESLYKASRDKAVAAEWAFHNSMLGSKDQVKAQFGKNSNEVQAMGLKKVSEYKRPRQQSQPRKGRSKVNGLDNSFRKSILEEDYFALIDHRRDSLSIFLRRNFCIL